MPPRPFPHHFTTGIDICHIPRLAKYIPPHFTFRPSAAAAAALPLHLPYPASPIPYPTQQQQQQEQQQQEQQQQEQQRRQQQQNGRKKGGGAESDKRREFDLKTLNRLLDKMLTPNETRQFWMRFRSWEMVRRGGREVEADLGGERAHAARWLAGRWAAKEAAIKACSASSPRRLFMRDVEVRVDARTQAPYGIVLDRRGPQKSAVSIYWGLQKSMTKEREKRREEGDAEATAEDGRGKPETKSVEPKKEILGPEGVLDFGAVVEALDESERSGEVDVEGQVVMISISHDGEYAAATAIAPLMGPAYTDGVVIGGGNAFRKTSGKPVMKAPKASSAR